LAQLHYDGRSLSPLLAGCALPVGWLDGSGLISADVSLVPELASSGNAPPPPADVCSIVFTSGTTGKPKAAMLTHAGLLLAARVQHDRVGPKDPGEARYLCNLPVNHVGCLMNQALSALVAGGSIVFQSRFDAGEALKLIARERITVWMAVPAVVHLCMTHADASQTDFSSLRSVLVGGGAMSLPTVVALRQMTRARLWAEYGQTETSSTATYTPNDSDDEALTGTIGAFEPRFDYRIARPDGSNCAVGEPGEIQGRGPLITPGYYRDTVATKAAFTADGWLKTGDLAELRPDGLVVLRGRAKEMIKSGGYNLYPREIEMRLETHPAIDLVVVVGLPDEVFGEAAHAVFSFKAGRSASHDELKAWCGMTLANYKVPKTFRHVAAMPLLSNGKLDRSGVRQLASTLTPLNGDKRTMKLNLHEGRQGFGWVDREIGTSRWFTIDQPRITEFGRVTEDPDPMHIDPDFVREHSPYGETIAFGFLTMSMLTAILNDLVARPADEVSTLNYGFDRLRLMSPVRVGRRIRGRLKLLSLELRTPTQFVSRYEVYVDIEGEDKPALYAQWLLMTNVREPRTA
jgi:non-ribosomal peptide synthetase component E (peptide arylation enzyme)/acyl dehydratase